MDMNDVHVPVSSDSLYDGSYSDALAYFEHGYFVRLLSKSEGNVEMAANIAELNIATLYRKIKKYNLR